MLEQFTKRVSTKGTESSVTPRTIAFKFMFVNCLFSFIASNVSYLFQASDYLNIRVAGCLPGGRAHHMTCYKVACMGAIIQQWTALTPGTYLKQLMIICGSFCCSHRGSDVVIVVFN